MCRGMDGLGYGRVRKREWLVFTVEVERLLSVKLCHDVEMFRIFRQISNFEVLSWGAIGAWITANGIACEGRFFLLNYITLRVDPSTVVLDRHSNY